MNNVTVLNFVELVGWMLVHSLWQLALIGAVYYIVAALFSYSASRTFRARMGYVWGCVCLLAMLLVPLVTLMIGQFENAFGRVGKLEQLVVQFESTPEPLATRAVTTGESAIFEDQTAATPTHSTSDWNHTVENLSAQTSSQFVWLVPLWICGVCLLSLRPLASLWRIRKLRTQGLTELPPPIASMAERMQAKIKTLCCVKFFQSTLVRVPTVVGFLKPVVLLPTSAITNLSLEQLELILAHELAHVRRYDYVVNIAQSAIEALLFYHPAVWMVSSQIRAERELCCDDEAVSGTNSAVLLAQALTKLEHQRSCSTPALAATGAGQASLVHRVRRLIEPTVPPKSAMGSLFTSLSIFALLLSGLVFATSTSSQAADPIIHLASPDAAPQETEETINDLKTVTYEVADLVVPIPFNHPARQNFPNFEKLNKIGLKIPDWMEGMLLEQRVLSSDVAEPDFKPLMNLIMESIAPESWKDYDGAAPGDRRPGHIAAMVRDLSIVVSATPQIHDEIQILLKQLRELSDNKIAVQSCIVVADRNELDSFFGKEELDGPINIDAVRFRQFHAFARAKSDWKLRSFEEFSQFNGQLVLLGWDGFDFVRPGFLHLQMVLHPEHATNGSARASLGFQCEGQKQVCDPFTVSGQATLLDVSFLLPDDSDQAAWMALRIDVKHKQ